MAKRAVKYAVIDAFTDTAFKGNPAAICLLEEGEDGDEAWLQSVATEFNVSETSFLTPIDDPDLPNPSFHLRWFTPVAEVKLCGHATLAAAHFLITSGLVRSNLIEFRTKSGILTAKKFGGLKKLDPSKYSDTETDEHFSIELDFPVIPLVECNTTEIPSIHETLNGASIVNVKKTVFGDLIVELASGKDVTDMQPQFDELKKCAGRGVIVTGPAIQGSRFDFFSRSFFPKLGINEDPVCGSAHCALAPYWRKRLGKCNFTAYMASPRGGRLDLILDEEKERVLIRGEAITVMVGSLLA